LTALLERLILKAKLDNTQTEQALDRCEKSSKLRAQTIARHDQSIVLKDQSIAQKNQSIAQKNQSIAKKDQSIALKNQGLRDWKEYHDQLKGDYRTSSSVRNFDTINGVQQVEQNSHDGSSVVISQKRKHGIPIPKSTPIPGMPWR
jgi:uncharacterized protein (DUF3084 family)